MESQVHGKTNRSLPWECLRLAALALSLSACGVPDQPEASPEPTKPFDAQALMSQDSVSTLNFELGSAMGSPVSSSNTCGAANANAPSCAYSAAPDHTYYWTAPYAGTFTFTTYGSSYDTMLNVYASSGAVLGCNDDAGGTLQSSLSLSLSGGQRVRIVVDGYAGNCGAYRLNISGSGAPVKRAMTWSLLGTAAAGSEAYALPGSDSVTNPYTGDTLTSQSLPVLCIQKNSNPHPGTSVIGNPVQTPGGACRRTWSYATIALTPPTPGTSLSSRSVADNLCASYFGVGFRMAEFHDGDPACWAGWDFWGEALGANLAPFYNTRFWVSINDQNANPW
jgi:hypothetical protein